MKRQQTLSFICASIFALLVSSCSSGGDENPKPSWIDNPEVEYPSQQYLTATGYASQRDVAANSALANLAKIFTVDINADTKEFSKAITSNSSGAYTIENTQELSRSVVTTTDLELEGAIIKETWVSPVGEHYALAILEKQRAARNLTQKIRNADQNTTQLLAYSKNTAPNVVLAFHALRQARGEQIKREIAHQQLIQVANKSIPNKTSSKEIETLIKQSLAQLSVATSAESDESNNVLQSALGQLGIPHADKSNLVLKAKLDTIDPAFKEEWFWLRGSYDLSLVDNGTVITHMRWPIKISAREEQLLQPRLQDEISKNLPDYLVELLSTPPK